MKNFIYAIALTSLVMAPVAHAGVLKGCILVNNGQIEKKIPAFDISNYETEQPEAAIDGNLLDYSKNEKTVKMSFSNECDNMYEIEFSTAAMEKAVNGEFKKLIGKAHIALGGDELDVTGTLICTVQN